MEIKITAINKMTGEREEVKDLYWFEENGVRWFDDKYYTIEIHINGVINFTSQVVRDE